MKLIAYVESSQDYSALAAFLHSVGGHRFALTDTSSFNEHYPSIKDELERYARTLTLDERFELYRAFHKLTTNTETNLVASKQEYTLEKSFLTEDEINILILKLIHEPISQSVLAQDVLLCSRPALSARIGNIKDGARIGAASVQLELRNKHKVSSTAHPVSLVLNLSEVYTLISTLMANAGQRQAADPKAVIEQGLAEMVYSQLSSYAKKQVDPSLKAAGIRMDGGVSPRFEGNALSAGRGASPSTDRERVGNWVYYEKSGRTARVTISSGDATRDLVGRILPGAVPASELASAPHANPASCFRLQLEDGSIEVLSWGNVVDVAKL